MAFGDMFIVIITGLGNNILAFIFYVTCITTYNSTILLYQHVNDNNVMNDSFLHNQKTRRTRTRNQ